MFVPLYRSEFKDVLDLKRNTSEEFLMQFAPVPFKQSRNPQLIRHLCRPIKIYEGAESGAADLDFSSHCLAQVAGPLLCFGGSREIFSYFRDNGRTEDLAGPSLSTRRRQVAARAGT